MRTTVDLPGHLMQAARVRAAERGETLKDIFTRAIVRELGTPIEPQQRGRMALPLVGRGADPEIAVTNADLEAALAADDASGSGS